MNFNASITKCMAKAMEDLSDFACVSMANVTLVRFHSYLAHVKSVLKQDTLAALSQAPMQRKAEEDISKFEDKGWFHAQSGGQRDSCFNPYKRLDKQTQEWRSGKPAWKMLGHFSKKKDGRWSKNYSSRPGQPSHK